MYVNKQQYISEIQKNALVTDDSSFATVFFGDIKDDYCFCVMEYVPGCTLKEFLSTNPCFFYRWMIVRGVCDSLSGLYKKGIYHGDLHTGNIIWDWEMGSFRILDLGTSVFSGTKQSEKRDAKLIYRFGIKTLPEIKDIPFFADNVVKGLPSPLITPSIDAYNQAQKEEAYESYYFPNLSEKDTFLSLSPIIDTPLFSLELIEQYLVSVGFSDDRIEMFYNELFKRLNCISIMTGSKKGMVLLEYESRRNKYIEDQINLWNAVNKHKSNVTCNEV